MAESLPLVEECEAGEISKILKCIFPNGFPPDFELSSKCLNADFAISAMKTVRSEIGKAVCYVVDYIRQLELLHNAKEFLKSLSLGKEFQAISKVITKAEEKIKVVEMRIKTLNTILDGPTTEGRPLKDQEKKSFDALTIQLDISLEICQGYLDQIKEKLLKVEEKVQVVSVASTFGKCFSFAAGAITAGRAYATYGKVTKLWTIGFGASGVGFLLLGLGIHVVGKGIEGRLSDIQEFHDVLQNDLNVLQKEFLALKKAEKALQ